MESNIEAIPENVGLIPDGNRRWAKTHKMDLLRGYDAGINKFLDFSLWLRDLGAKTLTVWALSTENIKNRKKNELDALYKLYIKTTKDKRALGIIRDNKVKIRVIGNMNLLPDKVRRALKGLERDTRNNRGFKINLLIGYGGRDDIIYAFKKFYAHAMKIGRRIAVNEDVLRSSLRTYAVPDPDLVIRTSGEMRLSGFLPWQTAYSELYFAEKYWPEFQIDDLKKALTEFQKRKRRYGK